MATTSLADTLSEWKDFPKGLRVLVLDEDSEASAQTKSKLEAFDYVVYTFSNEVEASAAVISGTHSFHVALVEVTTGNISGSFRFLETASDLPTIMMSNTNCLSTTMKCLALGAAEFLQKPISEDKLKNIWQHVVQKAFSRPNSVLSNILKPVKSTVASMLHLGSEDSLIERHEVGDSGESMNDINAQHEALCDLLIPANAARLETMIEACNNERFPAPSTPQLEQGGRSTPHDDLQDKTLTLDKSTNLKAEAKDGANNFGYKDGAEVKVEAETTSEWSSQVESLVSIKKGSQQMDGIKLKRSTKRSGAKSDDITEDKLHNETRSGAPLQSKTDGHVANSSGIVHEEEASADDSKSYEENIVKEVVMSSYECSEENVDSSTEDTKGKKSSVDHARKRNRNGSSKKKLKVEWTMDLHRRFLQAVEQLGVDQAIPSRILELMKVDGLTRHNVASHLQKYRSHRKHIMSREDEVAGKRGWQHFDPNWTRAKQDGSWNRKGNTSIGPALVYSPVQIQPTPHGSPFGLPFYVWGHPTTDQSARHMWQKLPVGTPTTWQAQDASLWKHPRVYADAWGCPMPGMPFYPEPMVNLPSTIDAGSGRHFAFADPASGFLLWEKPLDVYPPKELLDEAIKEALNNPWTPLPLGLKPPSMESVIAELQKQGINKIPPPAL